MLYILSKAFNLDWSASDLYSLNKKIIKDRSGRERIKIKLQ